MMLIVGYPFSVDKRRFDSWWFKTSAYDEGHKHMNVFVGVVEKLCENIQTLFGFGEVRIQLNDLRCRGTSPTFNTPIEAFKWLKIGCGTMPRHRALREIYAMVMR
jgi:hypothetical protein